MTKMQNQKFKQTEIGLIPEDWEIDNLGKFGIFRGGNGFPLRYQGLKEEKYPFFKVSDMNNFGNEIFMKNSNNYISEQIKRKINPFIFPKNTIILAKIGAAIFLERKKILIQESCIDNNLMGFFIEKEEIDFNFMYYFLKKIKLGSLVHSTALPALGEKEMREIKIPYPKDPKEQKAIAQVLSDTDELIGSLTKLIEKKKNIKQGIMQELLTGKKRLFGFNGEWEEKRLGDIGTITGAGVDKKINSWEEPIRLLNYMDVYKKNYLYQKELNHWVTTTKSKISSCEVKKGDLFFTPSSETREDIGISAIAMEDMEGVVYSYHIDRFRLNIEFDELFGLYMLKTNKFLSQCETICEGSGKRYVISMGKFRDLLVKFPKDIKEQEEISKIIYNLDSEIESLERKRDKYKKLKIGMMQELLSGRIRLI